LHNIKLTIEYDGTAYVGWQRQPSHHGMSVQQTLEDAFKKLLKHKTDLLSAGRTDAGVHALGQVANFYTDCNIPIEKIPIAINNLLPRDIRVRTAQLMDQDFHARYSAHSKTYRYHIYHGGPCSVFEERYVWQLPQKLDIDAMKKAANLFLGEHDFKNFSVLGGSVKTTVRNISRLEVTEPEKERLYAREYYGQSLMIEVSANGFLYKMVRLITASLVEIGRGVLDEEKLLAYIERKATHSIPPAPAKGLLMLRVDYGVPSSKL